MEQINFKDFRITPDITTVRNEEIDDNTYFSEKYSKFVSNSGLKWIDPKAGGSPELFKNHPKLKTNALKIGSAVHELLLQPDDFELANINKPNAKLGDVMDYALDFIKQGTELRTAVRNAAVKADYFVNTIDKKLDNLCAVFEEYKKELEKLPETDKELILLSPNERALVNALVNSCKDNNEIMSKLHPIDAFGDPTETHFEDAFFIDYIVTYKNRYCDRIPFKMKADNWTIDFNNKVLTLNDLKTTGHSLQHFMGPEDSSWNKFSYARQMFCYSQILWYWCMKHYGISKEQGWILKANMLVVETIPNYWSRSFYVSDNQLRDGRKMFNELMSMVAYYNIFGYDKEVEWI